MSISTVTSESLQLKLRQLLPSQQGFGTDLSASDTIIPVIDLTAAAEGSDTSVNLQTALAFGSSTAFDISNATTALVTTTGFYQVQGGLSLETDAGSEAAGGFIMGDGSSNKTLWQTKIAARSTDFTQVISFDLVFWLRAGDTLSAFTNTNSCFITGSHRQIADSNGSLVQPTGFTPQ